MDIYTILSSKPHNPHYLNRYITFIEQCQLKNVAYEGYTERHHICPKANDMFPEYSSFSDYPWNLAILTARQHFIAHVMLWKVFPTVNSITFAAHSLRSYQNKKINSRLYESLNKEFRMLQSKTTLEYHANMSEERKKEISHKISSKAKNIVIAKTRKNDIIKVTREEFNENKNLTGITKGMTTMKDSEGNYHYVSVKDPRIKSGELTGPNKGRIFDDTVRKKLSKIRKGRKLSDVTKEKMRKPKGPQDIKECPHCNKKGGASNMTRYHFDNCKNYQN